MNLVNVIQPWTPTIQELAVDPELIQPLLEEALLQPKGASTNLANLDTPVSKKAAPKLHAFVHDDVKTALLNYLKMYYHTVPNHLDCKSWVRVTVDGSGLTIHEHAGAHLTCIVYLEGNGGDVIFQDPRGNAGRSYPMSVRNQHFQPLSFEAKPGRVLIFPSYLFHYVEKHTPSLRAVLTTDVFIKDNP